MLVNFLAPVVLPVRRGLLIGGWEKRNPANFKSNLMDEY
jgi:hypothetical protein